MLCFLSRYQHVFAQCTCLLERHEEKLCARIALFWLTGRDTTCICVCNLFARPTRTSGVKNRRFVLPNARAKVFLCLEELLAPKGSNQCFPVFEPRFPSSTVRASRSQTLEPMLPNLGTTAAQFEELLAPKGPNQCFPVLEPRFPSSTVGASRSQTLEPMLHNLGTTGSQLEELLVPKGSNECFPVLEPRVSSSSNW